MTFTTGITSRQKKNKKNKHYYHKYKKQAPVHIFSTGVILLRKQNWKAYVFFIVLSEAIGVISGLLSRGGMEAFNSIEGSALTPPAIVFPVVWTVLYALMGIGAARIWLAETSDERSRSLIIYFVQLAVNFFWSIIFFNIQAYGFALVWLILLWFLIALMILSYRSVDRIASWLQLPYFIWVTFAAYLNYSVWIMN